MPALTERQIALNRDRLFAWGQGINVPTPFANRLNAVNSLQSILKDAEQSKPRRIICVSDLLGSGKTFLVNNVLNQLNAMALDVRILSPELQANLSHDNKAPYEHVQIVDEWDIKAPAWFWEKGLNALNENYNRWAGTYILVGDETLKCAFVQQRLTGMADVEYFDLEQLTQHFFFMALETRVADCFEGMKADSFLDAGLVNALIPPWSKTCATFRATFSVLEQVAQTLIPSDTACYLKRPHVAQWMAQRPTHMNPSSQKAAAAIIDHVRTNVGDMQILSDEELGELIQLDCRSSDFEDVRTALVRAEYLQSVGTPQLEADGKYQKRPAPYLPGRRATLGAYAIG
jgi:hypothetical protein